MSNFERSVVALRTFADEHIECWSEVYLANPHLRARGVLFETFLLAPAKTLAACGTRPVMIVARAGLLPRQRAAQARIDTEAALLDLGERAIAALAAECHCANGVWTEKLKHRAWPHRRPAKRKLMEVSGGN